MLRQSSMEANLVIRTLTQSTEWLPRCVQAAYRFSNSDKRDDLMNKLKQKFLLRATEYIDDHQNQATDLIQIQDSINRQPQAPWHKPLC